MIMYLRYNRLKRKFTNAQTSEKQDLKPKIELRLV